MNKASLFLAIRRGLEILEPHTDSLSLDYVPEVFPLNGAPANPNTTLVGVVLGETEPTEAEFEELTLLGWTLDHPYVTLYIPAVPFFN